MRTALTTLATLFAIAFFGCIAGVVACLICHLPYAAAGYAVGVFFTGIWTHQAINAASDL